MTNSAPFIVGLVPAKLTSRRLPRKNLALLNGVPLVLHSVRAACLSSRIDQVYVSTESAEVEKVVKDEDCILIRRPEELSAPAITNFHVLSHALEACMVESGRRPDMLVLLQPSHPFRRPGEIDDAVNQMLKTPQASCLVTVAPMTKAVGHLEKGCWQDLTHLDRERGIDDRQLFRNEGNIYIFRPDLSIARGNYFGNHIIAYQLERPELDIDIDHPWDLEFANIMCSTNPLARHYLSQSKKCSNGTKQLDAKTERC